MFYIQDQKTSMTSARRRIKKSLARQRRLRAFRHHDQIEIQVSEKKLRSAGARAREFSQSASPAFQ